MDPRLRGGDRDEFGVSENYVCQPRARWNRSVTQ